MKKVMLVLFLALFVLGCVFAGGTTEATTAEKSYTFQLGNVWLSNQAVNVALEEVVKKIETRTNGTIKIQIFPDGQIASYKNAVEQVVSGANFIACDDPSMMDDYVPDFAAFVGPYLYDSFDQFEAVCKSPLAESLIVEAKKAGIHVLALNYIQGYRTYVGNKAVNSPATMKGVVLRVPSSPLWAKTMAAMGSTVTTLPWAEVYSGLSTGVIDALETTLSDMVDNNLYEVAKNVSLTNHGLMTLALIMNEDIWNSLSENQRKVMQEEFAAGAIINNEIVRESEANATQKLKAEGMIFNDVDTVVFKNSVESVYSAFPSWSDDILNRIQAEVKAISGK